MDRPRSGRGGRGGGSRFSGSMSHRVNAAAAARPSVHAFPISYEDTSTFVFPTTQPMGAEQQQQNHNQQQRPSKPPKRTNPVHSATSHTQPRRPQRNVESKDDHEEDLHTRESDEFSEDDFDDDDDYVEDEDNIFDMAEQAMVDGKRMQDVKQKQQQQQQSAGQSKSSASSSSEQPLRRKREVVTKKEKQQRMQQAQPQQHQQQPSQHARPFHPQPHPQPHAHVKQPPARLEDAIGSGTSADPTLTRKERAFLRAKEEAARMRQNGGGQQHQHQHQPHDGQPKVHHAPSQQQQQNQHPQQSHAKPQQAPKQPQPANSKQRGFDDQPPRNNNFNTNVRPSSNSPPTAGGGYRNNKSFFSEHLALNVLQAGITQGMYVSGILRIVGSNAFVTVTGLPRDVFIEGRKNRNRAYDGDTVCIQISGFDTGVKMQLDVGLSTNGSKARGGRGGNQASLQASLESLILNSSQAEDAKMEAEALAKKQKQQPGNHIDAAAAWPVVEEPETALSSSAAASTPHTVLIAKLASVGPDVQHKGIVLGVLAAKFPVLHVPGLLKPYSQTLALFVPLDRKTPFAMLPERSWPEVWKKEYGKYLLEQAKKKEEKAQALRDRKVKGNFPASPESSSDVVNEASSASSPAPVSSSPEASPEEPDIDAMTAATGTDSVNLDPTIYVATYSPWLATDRQPFCVIEKALGLSGNILSETEALLISNGVDYDLDGKFESVVLNEVASYAKESATGEWQIPAAEIAKRRDFRDQTQTRIVSIDPTTAKDLDDAIHIKDLGGDEVEIGVHIADVSHFVRPGTALDAEARHRATTIYLVNKAIPMLPPILCEQLCSLNPNVDRLAYSCVFYMSKSTGKLSDKKKPWFGKSVIRTCARLNYETAQWLMEFDRSKLNGRPATEADFEGQLKENMQPGHPYRPVDCVSIDELLSDMQLLHRVSMRRRKDRFEVGSLTLSNVKLSFKLDQDRNPCGFYTYPIYDSNRVVEECMLLANMLVASQCVLFCKNVALLRRHPPPNEKSMAKVSQSCQELGFNIDASTAGTLQRSLDAYEGMFVGKTHEVNDTVVHEGTIPLRQVLEPLCTKPMQLAKYFCTNDSEPKEWHHYALHFDEYTHFTSPIRRYADVIVHRVLSYSLELEAWKAAGSAKTRPRVTPSLTPDEVAEIAEICNTRKANAKKCQEASSKVYLCDYLVRHHSDIPLTHSAVIIDLFSVIGNSDPSFDILIPNLGIEKKIHLNDLIKSGKITSGEIEPRDPPDLTKPIQTSQQQKNNRPTSNVAASSPPPSTSPSTAAGSTAPVLKSAKRMRLTWPDGSSNVYSIFESIDVELLVRKGPPMDLDAAVIGPAEARAREAKKHQSVMAVDQASASM